ncbi:MAG: HAD family hydrolase [Balneolales bacterium]|nr:HAD family hydrolase [Balneolales bacterium]
MSTSYTQKQHLLSRIKELSAPLEPKETGETPVLIPLIDIKAVVFDFYGTMFMSGTGDTIIDDPKGEETVAFKQAFEVIFPDSADKVPAELGVQLYKEVIHDHKEAMRKEGLDYPEVQIKEVWADVLSRLRKHGFEHLPEEPEEELLENLTIEFEMRNNPTWPFSDLENTLELLKEKSLYLGILSNSQFYTPLIYEAHLESAPDDDLFDVNLCIWSYEEKRCKPSLPFHGQLKMVLDQHFGIQPEQVLYVGNDMLKDIYPAAHFGFRTALFAGDDRSLKWRKDDERCANLLPDLVITRLDQLVECL